MKNEILKSWMAVAAFVCAIGFGVAAFCCPPLSIIDSSVLYFTAQIFLFISTLLGVNLDLGRFGSSGKNNKRRNEDEE